MYGNSIHVYLKIIPINEQFFEIFWFPVYTLVSTRFPFYLVLILFWIVVLYLEPNLKEVRLVSKLNHGNIDLDF